MGKNHTLCWDCEKAVGGCSWTDHWSHKPVEGWVAEPRRLRLDNNNACTSYVVRECPEFVRDAFDGGVNRLHDLNMEKELKKAMRKNSWAEICKKQG